MNKKTNYKQNKNVFANFEGKASSIQNYKEQRKASKNIFQALLSRMVAQKQTRKKMI